MEAKNNLEKHPAWEDWEDHGGFDDEEALMGILHSRKKNDFLQERPWYYEKNKTRHYAPQIATKQLSFL